MFNTVAQRLADQQYYLVAATLAGTMWYIIQIMEAFAKDFGLYINIGSIKCTLITVCFDP
jgi:hypothetical protein